MLVDALRLSTYSAAMPLPRGFVPPCLPTKAPEPPTGGAWLHEIKHDGFRVIARKDGDRVRLYSRPGNDLTYRFPLIVEFVARLRSRDMWMARSFPRIPFERYADDAICPCTEGIVARAIDTTQTLRNAI